MTDKELLEMAAKAAEFGQESKHGPCWTESEYPRGSKTHGALWNYIGYMDTAELWNPLTDDGDALRLAVKLRIDLSLWLYKNSAEAKTHIGAGRGISLTSDNPRPINSHREGNGNDPYAATRRAIVRAAAEIGKAMP